MRARWILVSLVVIVAASSPAGAQSVSVQADSLFADGHRLMDEGKVAEACAAFESSQKLDPRVTTLLNLAGCRELNHQLATAWGLFVEAGRMARASKDDKLERVATSHAHKLEPRLSRLTIAVAADRQVAGLEILRGGEPINAAGWNHALPIDGGSYTITARAPGRTPWSITKTIKVEGDAQTIEIPKLADPRPVAVAAPPVTTPPPAAKPAPAKPAALVDTTHTGGPPEGAPAATASAQPTDAPARAARDAEPVPEAPAPRSPYLVPLLVGGGAIGLGGGALAFKLVGDSKYDSAKRATVQSDRDALYQQANSRRYVAEGLTVAAIGCAGVAVYLYVRNRGEQRAETAAVTPIASPGLAGLAVVGSW